MQELIQFGEKHPLLCSAILAVFALLFIVEVLRLNRVRRMISPADATQLINRQRAEVLDLRSKEQFKTGHIIDSTNVSAQELVDNPKKIEKFKQKPLVIVCPTGGESQKVAALLAKKGYNSYSIAGGIRAWVDAQMPLVKE